MLHLIDERDLLQVLGGRGLRRGLPIAGRARGGAGALRYQSGDSTVFT